MNKKLFFLLFVISTGFIYAQQIRNCGTMQHLQDQSAKDPSVIERMQQIEDYTAQKLLENRSGKFVGNIFTLPVVVHVIYNTQEQNISDAQILSQIEVLNEDFRRTNGNADNIWSQATDTQIEFALAEIDPNGNTTTGITRTFSTVSEWEADDTMKSSFQGGVNAWNSNEYLNMWVCPLKSGLLGYAQFPGGNVATDGVVMSPQYFGSSDKGSGFFLSEPFDKGRTATHEVGHFLNLRHIWGDGNCGADDFVSDTPQSDDPNYGCADSHTSCGSLDMVQNYMDYSNDACMSLFTEGQKDRMRSILEIGGSRRQLAVSDKFEGGDVVIIDDPIIECSSVISSFPFDEGFENIGDVVTEISWEQSSNDDGDWISNSLGTPSSGTGPSAAIEGASYMYLEASVNGTIGELGSNATAILESPCFDLTNVPVAMFTFKNHMYGTNMGSLELEISINGNSTWNSIWSLSGDQGDVWNSEAIDLNAYLGQVVKLRFVGTTGSNYESDIAIDDIVLSTSVDDEGDDSDNITYCESTAEDSSFEWIDYVAFAELENSSGNDGGYADFTSIGASVEIGNEYTLVFSADFDSTSYTEYWKVWIDYDQNGTFEDDEVIAVNTSTSSANVSQEIVIPSTAVLGTTRMRVSMNYSAEETTACQIFQYGEVEDYSITILSGNRIFDNDLIAKSAVVETLPSMVVYPNPAKNIFTIKLIENINETNTYTYKVISLVGKIVLSGNVTNNEINISSLASGLYLIEVFDGEKIRTTKLVKE